ncbi:VWA domain-containing protein [Sphaerospermopsis aphanizomenoides BCCUSP55]|uniref:vWA domain-containing protein n=1 Tax=Sphaerospermopsis aphanizomenoides TaxID=459663 RepID=UPI001903EA28|nr:VWA domain-containing protein [Sphaerospermopsis aphanizomenoides]MBK1987907.1 VWA domain-containing protein [Sphaerospermopsis aphanizomenoides BCCUSP55]
MLQFFSNLKQKFSKPLLFGIYGAIGCFLAAIFGEILFAVALPSEQNLPPPSQVDIMFVLDVTGSMGGEIKGVQRGIQRFAKEFSSRNLDGRVGLIAFRDRQEKEEPEILSFNGSAFTSNACSFSQEVGKQRAYGGGDDPESSLDALALAARQSFRPEATKVLLLITDALPKIPDREMQSVGQAVGVLRENKINQLHLVVQKSDRYAFEGLQTSIPGEVFLLDETASARNGFDRILPLVGQKIAETTIQGLQSNRKFSTKSVGLLTLIISASTGILAIGIALALIVGQNHYQHRRLLTLREGSVTTLGSLTAGMIAGAVSQLLFLQVSRIPNAKEIEIIVNWAIISALLMGVMSFIIPKVKKLKLPGAILAGAISGALSAVGLILTSGMGDFLSRLAGAIIFGFTIRLLAGSFLGLAAAIAIVVLDQCLFLTLTSIFSLEIMGRIVGWSILGTLVGCGTPFFVPNLQLIRALFGGGVGGTLGAIGFVVSASVSGDISGRLLGAAILGFCIGLMIAWAEKEQLNQEPYLVVHWGEIDKSEKTLYPLGTKPFLLGSSREANIPLNASQGFTPITAKIYKEGEKIIMHFDQEYAAQKNMKKTIQELKVGDRRIFGRITIEVKSETNSKPT